MNRVEREAAGLGIKLVGVLLVVAAGWFVLAWPYMASGWIAEGIYLAALIALVPLGVRLRRRHQARLMAVPRWRQSASDPAGLLRWWDGTDWTDTTQWEFHAVRPDTSGGRITHYTHGSCTIRHRSQGAAARCRSEV